MLWNLPGYQLYHYWMPIWYEAILGFQLFLSAFWFISLSFVACGQSWRSKMHQLESSPRIASCEKNNFLPYQVVNSLIREWKIYIVFTINPKKSTQQNTTSKEKERSICQSTCKDIPTSQVLTIKGRLTFTRCL